MDLEPAPNEWDFKRADYYVKYARQHNADIIFTLGQTPSWAAKYPHAACTYGSGCSQPSDLRLWRAYVRKLVERYGAQVRYWELWNEPDYSGFWRGSPEMLADMAKIASEEIHARNLNSVLIGPAITPRGINFLDRFLSHPQSKYLQYISFHYYINENKISDLLPILDNVRSVIRGHEIGDIPIWITEFGINCPQRPASCAKSTKEEQTAELNILKAIFLSAAKGVKNMSFYNWERRLPQAPISLSEPNYLSLSPVGQEYAKVVNLLSGSVISKSYIEKGVYFILLRKNKKNFVVMWPEFGDAIVKLPTNWRFRSLEAIPYGDLGDLKNGTLKVPNSAIVVGLL
ncbi:glycosyl hydrolase [Novosphingobium mangrovi (ex Huang et al. 2023)]|uniref:Glycosyl hydrolase n=1 Tax=Novosphingobium mangrovi (ex Huang et al. 2023) TaxID=2976432 RepID=A0ABT2I6U8_9SPHN|nr:glycosyl hydrolase [Novosphingobium mangrovi (ex Huang et al. 2023)]MCT2400287.1 glycosyl hydrolase [Novosphingobium mangrovi (ex Huang et al. 2023)]